MHIAEIDRRLVMYIQGAVLGEHISRHIKVQTAGQGCVFFQS